MSREMLLYGYWRSTAAYRVRIALELKSVPWSHRGVHLVRDGGEQHGEAYRAINPAGLVPTLDHEGTLIRQSLAICEYLDELYPDPPLLPANPVERARARAMAFDIASDVHPLNNLRVQQYLGRELGVSEADRVHWMHHWMRQGFAAVERLLERQESPRDTCFSPGPGLPDICLVAQAYNADRFGFSLTDFPRVSHVVDHCRSLEAFQRAAPAVQPDTDS